MTVLEPVIEFLMKFSGKKVRLDQVMEGAERPRKPVLRVMDRLGREGNLEEIADDPVPPGPGVGGRLPRNPTWRIIEKPLLGNFVFKPGKVTLRDKMWRLIRARRRFTRSELIRLSGAKLGSCETYTKMLVRDGYLRQIGKDGHQLVYMLVKDPGPKRPVTPERKKNRRRKTVEDKTNAQ